MSYACHVILPSCFGGRVNIPSSTSKQLCICEQSKRAGFKPAPTFGFSHLVSLILLPGVFAPLRETILGPKLLPAQLLDQAALFNLSKKARVDEIRRRHSFQLRIVLAPEHGLERLLVGRRQAFQQIGRLIVKISLLLGAQSA